MANLGNEKRNLSFLKYSSFESLVFIKFESCLEGFEKDGNIERVPFPTDHGE